MRPDQKEMMLAALCDLGSCDVVVDGMSMWPFIRPGDVVTIVRTAREPVPGNVVGFFSGDQFIVHRVVGRQRRGHDAGNLWVRGDSSPGPRSSISSSSVIGTVISAQRGRRRSSGWLRPPLSVIAVVLGRAVQALVRLKRRCRREEELA